MADGDGLGILNSELEKIFPTALWKSLMLWMIHFHQIVDKWPLKFLESSFLGLASLWRLRSCWLAQHHHHHHLFLKRPFLPRSARVRRLPRYEASPHIPEHCPSWCKPSSSMSSFTHSLHVFLPLPTHLTPATITFLQADTQSSPFLRSTCPNQ